MEPAVAKEVVANNKVIKNASAANNAAVKKAVAANNTVVKNAVAANNAVIKNAVAANKSIAAKNGVSNNSTMKKIVTANNSAIKKAVSANNAVVSKNAPAANNAAIKKVVATNNAVIKNAVAANNAAVKKNSSNTKKNKGNNSSNKKNNAANNSANNSANNTTVSENATGGGKRRKSTRRYRLYGGDAHQLGTRILNMQARSRANNDAVDSAGFLLGLAANGVIAGIGAADKARKALQARGGITGIAKSAGSAVTKRASAAASAVKAKASALTGKLAGWGKSMFSSTKKGPLTQVVGTAAGAAAAAQAAAPQTAKGQALATKAVNAAAQAAEASKVVVEAQKAAQNASVAAVKAASQVVKVETAANPGAALPVSYSNPDHYSTWDAKEEARQMEWMQYGTIDYEEVIPGETTSQKSDRMNMFLPLPKGVSLKDILDGKVRYPILAPKVAPKVGYPTATVKGGRRMKTKRRGSRSYKKKATRRR
jgi:hypothetical protein